MARLPSEAMLMETYKFDRFMFQFEQSVTPELLRSMGGTRVGESYIDNVTQNLIFKLTQFWWGENRQRIVIDYPANWKESFKERWFPRWLIRKYPVKYTRQVIDAAYVYPDLYKEQLTGRQELILQAASPREITYDFDEERD